MLKKQLEVMVRRKKECKKLPLMIQKNKFVEIEIGLIVDNVRKSFHLQWNYKNINCEFTTKNILNLQKFPL